jgi:hypothetical protein
MTAVGLYALLNQFMNPKKSDYDQGPKFDERKKKGDKTIDFMYMCSGAFYSLLYSKEGLKSETANQIERILRKDQIVNRINKFWFCSNNQKDTTIIKPFFENKSYAAALYLINEEQRESFKDEFTEGCSVYDLYKIKPTSTKNFWCYVLPLLECSVDHEGKETYSLNISSEITQENIHQYAFQLNEADAANINLNAQEITGVEYILRNNRRKGSGESDISDYF